MQVVIPNNAFKGVGAIRAPLPHNPGNAARLLRGTGKVIFQIARGRCAHVARTDIGPGPAALVAFTGLLTAFAGGIGRHVELLVIAPEAIHPEFERATARLDHAGSAHARRAARRRHPRRDLRLEPADRVRALSHGVGKRPGAATLVLLTARGTLRRVAGAGRQTRIVAAGSVEADLRHRRRAGEYDG